MRTMAQRLDVPRRLSRVYRPEQNIWQAYNKFNTFNQYREEIREFSFPRYDWLLNPSSLIFTTNITA